MKSSGTESSEQPREREALRGQLGGHIPQDDKERSDVKTMLDWLGELAEPFRPDQREAHFTASAIVVDPSSERVCLVLHRFLNRWLQPGGHADESDVDLQETALREAREETGLDLKLHPSERRPFDIDVHLFPERDGFPAHYHLDLRFLLIAENPEALAHRDDESLGARWFTWEEALGLPSEPSMKRMLRKAQTLARSRGNTTT